MALGKSSFEIRPQMTKTNKDIIGVQNNSSSFDKNLVFNATNTDQSKQLDFSM